MFDARKFLHAAIAGHIVTLTIAIIGLASVGSANAGTLIANSSEPYGTFRGIDYVVHRGRFAGTTRQGNFLVPYEIVAPVDSRRANRKLVFEPPHFLFGPGGRNSTLGPSMLFERRYSHATVGFSNNGGNILDPNAVDALIADELALAENAPPLRDVEIMQQFVDALSSDTYAVSALGRISKVYAYGVSQSAEAIYEMQFGGLADGLFDLTVLHVPLWRPAFADPRVLAALPDTFEALPNVGKVMIVSAEGDLLISESLELRNAVVGPGASDDYRLYEVAGAPHLAQDFLVQGVRLNPLDVSPVVRAAFERGDRWVTRGRRPPATTLIDSSAAGEIDPIYWIETGIARDINGNASGGLRFPDVDNGRALHIASALDIEIEPGLPGLIGFWFDLACAPAPDGSFPRFASEREYVRSVIVQVLRLRREGYLGWNDARAMIADARTSGVGSPGYCSPL